MPGLSLGQRRLRTCLGRMPALLPQAAVRGVQLLSLVVVLAENVPDVGRLTPQVDVVASHLLVGKPLMASEALMALYDGL